MPCAPRSQGRDPPMTVVAIYRQRKEIPAFAIKRPHGRARCSLPIVAHSADLSAWLRPFAALSCGLQEGEQLRGLLILHGYPDGRGDSSLIRYQKLHGNRHDIGIARIKNRHGISDRHYWTATTTGVPRPC